MRSSIRGKDVGKIPPVSGISVSDKVQVCAFNMFINNKAFD